MLVFAASVLALVTPAPQQDFDGGPSAAQGVPQSVGFDHVSDLDVVAQAHLLLVGVGEAGAGQQAAELFLDPPGGGEVSRGVVGGEGCVQAGPAAG